MIYRFPCCQIWFVYLRYYVENMVHYNQYIFETQICDNLCQDNSIPSGSQAEINFQILHEKETLPKSTINKTKIFKKRWKFFYFWSGQLVGQVIYKLYYNIRFGGIFFLIIIFVRDMEENLKVVDLKGLSNNEYIEQFRSLIADCDVEKISFFITYKPKKQKQKAKIDKNIQEKTYEAITVIKQKKSRDQTLKSLKINYKVDPKQQEPFLDQISRLYELGEYQNIISMIKSKQGQSNGKQNLPNQIQAVKERNKVQYNFITFTLGNCYFRLKKHDLAIQQYQKFTQDEPNRQRAQRMNNLGTCFAIKNSYQQALKAYNEATKFYSECQEEDVSSLLNNIAMIYLKCQMYKTAEQYFIESINQRKAKTPNNKAMLYNSYFNLGVCQKKSKKLEESLNNLLIALNYASDGFGKKVDVINQICQVYQEQEKWSEALCYYEKLSQEYQILSKPQGPIYQRVSKIHQGRGNAIMAAKYAKRAFKLYYQQGNQRKMSELSGSPLVNMPNSL